MSDLLERTRAAALERVRAVRRSLADVASPDAPGFEVALRELHAIKGETAMAGLRSLSRLVHGFESLLLSRRRQEPLFLEDALEALRVLAELLASTSAAELVGSSDLEDLEVEVLAAGRVSFEADASGPAPPSGPAREEVAPPVRSQGAPPERAVVRSAPERGHARVATRDLDELADLVSEVAAELDLIRGQLAPSGAVAAPAGPQARQLGEGLAALRARVGMAEERAWQLRLAPVAPLFDELADHLEGLAGQLGKSARVEVDAHAVALERRVLEAVREALLHLGRNAIDHGIERPEQRGGKARVGRIRLGASSEGGEVVISVEDDGGGLDPEAILRRAVELGLVPSARASSLRKDEIVDLIFSSGFSQRTTVTELSGRGVGLAAVRRVVEDLGGTVRALPRASGGTRFELVLPAAVVRQRVLVVEALGLSWAIPSRYVRTIVRDVATIAHAKQKRMLRTPEGIAPVRALGAWIGGRSENDSAAVVVDVGGRRVALLVTRVVMEVDLLRAPADPVAMSTSRIAASGTLPGGGTAFFLRWAQVVREILHLREESVPEVERSQNTRARILVVDDSAVIRDIVGNVLTGAGLEVTTADDGRAALDLVLERSFDLVVSDVEMPRMNGLELLEHIRRRSEHLPVVMLTTRSTSEHRREAALLGANAYIAKSEFEGDALLDVVRRFVDAPAS